MRLIPMPLSAKGGVLRHLLSLVLLALFLLLAAPGTGPGMLRAEGEATEQVIDYAAWEKVATGAERELGEGQLANERLEELRTDLAGWRNRLNTAQTANSTRIATVKEQIAALGAAPADGATEASDIAQRRQELGDQLAKLQAPGLSAEEGYRRADGLIREIDATLRERQADQLLQVWPTPLNPANWAEAAMALSGTVVDMWTELDQGWRDPRAQAALYGNLPLILGLLALAAAAIVLARRWIETFADWLQGTSLGARRHALALIASLGQVIVPTIGVVALTSALVMTGMLGELTGKVAHVLPAMGLAIFAAIWLGGRTFPRQQEDDALLSLPPERRSEGRFESAMMGVVIALEALRDVAFEPRHITDAVHSVTSYPLLIAGGVLLWRIGSVLRAATLGDEDPEGANGAPARTYTQMIVNLLARACSVAGIAGPVLATFGYVQAGRALIYPAIVTLALLAMLLILQKLLTDIWAVLTRRSPDVDRQGLVPVLIGFCLTMLSVPVLALIWGARFSDLTEVWTRFREGFQLGETRISPTDFLVFVILFALGYMATRLFQGALRTTILPRTSMDRGGQNALVSGAGYVGIFLSALIGINATGIDLSGLAIVASALSVGIGFGLQNIVQNFVSGIILMIERPVSEGDWINVGGTEGIVKTISVRSTRIQTFDRSMVVVPNADLVSQRVTNLTRFSLAGRLIVPISVAWGQDTRRVETILREIAEAQAMVVLNPPPAILLQSFGAGALNFEIRVILRDVNFSGQVKNDINHLVVQRLIEEGISLPSASTELKVNPQSAVAGAAMAAVPRAGADTTMAPTGAARPAGRAGKPAADPASDETT